MKKSGTCLLTLFFLLVVVPIHADWVELDVVGGSQEEYVFEGGCAARGRGYTFVAIGGEESSVFPFVHSTETWDEDIFDDDMPDEITSAGAMAYEKRNHGRLFVATDVQNHLQVYFFHYPWGLEGHWYDPDTSIANPIELPEQIGPGVAIAFQPCENPASNLSGYLYLLIGATSRRLWRRAFPLVDWAPEGLGPGDGAVIDVNDLDFDWRTSPKWAAYQLQVAASRDFGTPVIDVVLREGEFPPPRGRLLAGRVYFWRVRGLCKSLASEWCEVRSLILTSESRPKQYELYPPVGFTVAGDPAFDWTSVSGACYYQLQVADNPDFTNPAVDTKTSISECCPAEALKSGKWFWRTRWQAASGEWSQWGAGRSFGLDVLGWDSMPSKPSDPIGEGGAMCHVIGSDNVEALYVLTGNNSNEFWRFNLDTAVWQWESRCTTLILQTAGASVTSFQNWWDARRLCAIMGGDDTLLYRYDIEDNEWEPYPSSENLPRTCGAGSSVVRDENDYSLVLTISGEYEPQPTNFYKRVSPPEDNNGPMTLRRFDPGPEATHVDRLSGSEVSLSLTLRLPGRVNVTVFDPAGRQVRNLRDGVLPAGSHDLTWNLTDQQGRRVRAGVYFIALDSSEGRTTLKVPVW